jgi:hypothetical protein
LYAGHSSIVITSFILFFQALGEEPYRYVNRGLSPPGFLRSLLVEQRLGDDYEQDVKHEDRADLSEYAAVDCRHSDVPLSFWISTSYGVGGRPGCANARFAKVGLDLRVRAGRHRSPRRAESLLRMALCRRDGGGSVE